MQSLCRSNLSYERQTLRTAVFACAEIDALAADLTPSRMGAIQHNLYQWRTEIEMRLRTVRARRTADRPRNQRIQARVARNPALKQLRGGHTDALEAQERLLEARSAVLQQIGDACAWLAMDKNPRLICPFYLPGHKRPLPMGLTGLAPFARMKELHETGQVLAVLNDLTRCLSTGDLTIRRIERTHPYGIPRIEELKSSVLHPEKVVESRVTTIESNHPLHVLTNRIFPPAVEHGAQVWASLRTEREERQLTALESALQNLLSVHDHPDGTVALNPTGYERLISDLVDRAMACGGEIAVPEPGVLMLAIRTRPNDNVVAVHKALWKTAQQSIGDELRFWVGCDNVTLLEDFDLAPRVLPLPLWDLPIHHRAALLGRAVFFAVTTSPNVMLDAMAAVGVNCETIDGHWVFSAEGKKGWAPSIDVELWSSAMRVGLLSPLSFAEQVKLALSQ